MDPIDGVGALSRLLRSRVSTEKRDTKVDGREKTASTNARVSLPELEKELKTRLKQIEAESGDTEKKTKAVLESVLAWEFGDKVRNEPKFNLLVTRIHHHLNNDKNLSQALHNLIVRLGS
ncbi:hypothetical protein [Microbulbifer sp. M83]|uniref:hypothetical protein n=1 Tax=Microbulbifer sp. M83 TaxID=3118246 RepID=UPI002FDF6F1C